MFTVLCDVDKSQIRANKKRVAISAVLILPLQRVYSSRLATSLYKTYCVAPFGSKRRRLIAYDSSFGSQFGTTHHHWLDSAISKYLLSGNDHYFVLISHSRIIIKHAEHDNNDDPYFHTESGIKYFYPCGEGPRFDIS